MNKIAYEKLDQDGVVQQGRLTLGNMIIETPGALPVLRTVREPDDLDFLTNVKDQYELSHIQGGVIRLTEAPVMLEPKNKIQEQLKNQHTIDGKPRPLDPFAKFKLGSIIVCDPVMEYTRLTRGKMDKKFITNLWFIDRLVRYFNEFEVKRGEIEQSKTMSIEALRGSMHDNFWFGSGKSDRRERNMMVEQMMRFQQV